MPSRVRSTGTAGWRWPAARLRRAQAARAHTRVTCPAVGQQGRRPVLARLAVRELEPQALPAGRFSPVSCGQEVSSAPRRFGRVWYGAGAVQGNGAHRSPAKGVAAGGRAGDQSSDCRHDCRTTSASAGELRAPSNGRSIRRSACEPPRSPCLDGLRDRGQGGSVMADSGCCRSRSREVAGTDMPRRCHPHHLDRRHVVGGEHRGGGWESGGAAGRAPRTTPAGTRRRGQVGVEDDAGRLQRLPEALLAQPGRLQSAAGQEPIRRGQAEQVSVASRRRQVVRGDGGQADRPVCGSTATPRAVHHVDTVA